MSYSNKFIPQYLFTRIVANRQLKKVLSLEQFNSTICARSLYHSTKVRLSSSVNKEIGLDSIPPIVENTVHVYLKEKELSSFCDTKSSESQDSTNESILECLERLSRNLSVNSECLTSLKSGTTGNTEDLVLSAPKYPRVSFSPDGFINVSLAKRSIYADFIRDARQYRLEEVSSNRRFYPPKNQVDYSHRRSNETAKLQRLLDSNLPSIIKSLGPVVLVRVLRQMYLLGLSIRAGNLAEISKRALKAIGSMTCKDLVELGLVIHGYMDKSCEHCRFLLCAIGLHLEKIHSVFLRETPEEVIKTLTPLVQMQLNGVSIPWAVLWSESLIQYLTDNIESLSKDSKAHLLAILTISDSNSLLDSDFLDERIITLADEIALELKALGDKAFLNLFILSENFGDKFLKLRSAVYEEALVRSNLIPADRFASAYLKLNASDSKEICDGFMANIQRRLKELSGENLSDIFCRFLRDGTGSRRQYRMYESALRFKCSSLSLRDISNVLMYQSMHGKSRSHIYDILKQRFVQIKQNGGVKHDELLDVVLSLSLVGLHRSKMWSDVDVPHLVFCTPHNILVYLGYAFLITNERSGYVWNVLLERMLFDSKQHTAEVYEVLKAAEILGFIKNDAENVNDAKQKRMESVLQQCRPLHLAKIARQRFHSQAPIEHVFKHIGLIFVKDKMISDLYEAPYFLIEHGIVVETSREPTKHVTTGKDVGEVQLRHNVYKKLGLKPFCFHEKIWDDFISTDAQLQMDGNDLNKWKIDEMAYFICKSIKLSHIYSARRPNRLPILRIKSADKHKNKLLPNRIKNQISNSHRIKRLKNLIIEKNTQK